MGVIYEPSGKAREYSPFALNIYLGCTHKCAYCYAPRCRHQTTDSYFQPPAPRKDLSEILDKELNKFTPDKQVLLSFIGDVYCETTDNNEETRKCLEVLLKHNVPVAILTKGGQRCLKDIDIFKRFGDHIQIGSTLTFCDKADSKSWEPGAALPQERLEVLKCLHDEGIKTFASFEPVIDPEQSLQLMRMGIDFIDTFKVGKLNNYKGIDKGIDWERFLIRTLDLLRPSEKSIYIKYDLRKCAPSVILTEREKDPDVHNVF